MGDTPKRLAAVEPIHLARIYRVFEQDYEEDSQNWLTKRALRQTYEPPPQTARKSAGSFNLG